MIHLRFLLASFALGVLPFARAESTEHAAKADNALRPDLSFRTSSGRAPSGIVAALDINKNGVLSAAEIANAPVVLKALDANEDDVLSPAELRRVALARPVNTANFTGVRSGRTSRMSPGFNVVFTLDANRDGDIQMMEIANAVSSLKTLDTNRDGELTLDELLPAAMGARLVASANVP